MAIIPLSPTANPIRSHSPENPKWGTSHTWNTDFPYQPIMFAKTTRFAAGDSASHIRLGKIYLTFYVASQHGMSRKSANVLASLTIRWSLPWSTTLIRVASSKTKLIS